MSAVVAVVGQIRTVREMRKKAEPGQGPGEVWGAIVSVLTEIGGILGETLPITVFLSDLRGLDPQLGDSIEWAVEISVGRYGQDAVFKTILAPVRVAA